MTLAIVGITLKTLFTELNQTYLWYESYTVEIPSQKKKMILYVFFISLKEIFVRAPLQNNGYILKFNHCN